jgi:hypothetical protein
MLNTEKWTTEGDIPRRKNWKGFHKAIWPMDNPPETREMILNFWMVEGAIFLTREKSIIWNCHHYWLDVNAWFTLICFEVREEWRPKYFVPNSTHKYVYFLYTVVLLVNNNNLTAIGKFKFHILSTCLAWHLRMTDDKCSAATQTKLNSPNLVKFCFWNITQQVLVLWLKNRL